MKSRTLRRILAAGLALVAAALCSISRPPRAQDVWGVWPPPPMPPPTTPDAQRSALGNVRARVNWLKNATRTAPGYATGGDGLVWQALRALRVEYAMFTRTVNPQQAAYGANELAELAAGLDILDETFGNYQADLAAGRPPPVALREMCQVLGRAADIWLQEFSVDCARLRVGR